MTESLPGSSQIDQNTQGDRNQIIGAVHHSTINYIEAALPSLTDQVTKPKLLQELISTSPYKGLKPFEIDDYQHFFGRNKLVLDLIEHLNSANLLLLLGASGSGKSSVIMAGLIPQLRKIKGNRFVTFIFKPDEDPFDAFYSSLLSQNIRQSEARAAREAHEDTLVSVVQKLQPQDSEWLIFIDQFEELFVRSHPDKRDIFIQSLARLYQYLNAGSQLSLKLVMTMRADFSDRLSRYPGLAAITYNQNNVRLIADMHPDELQRAVEQPAAMHGVVFEEGLVEEILAQVEGQPGYLPLLQYTLDLLWQHDDISDHTLNKSSYYELGGVRGALQQRIDQLYHASQENDTATAFKQVLLKLVSLEGAQAVRRRAYRSEFEADPITSEIVTGLIQEALLVSDLDRDGQRTVEIAHEALFSWSVFQTWMTEDGRVIALRNRLSDAVSRWLQAQQIHTDKATAELYRGSILEELVTFEQEGAFSRLSMPLSEDEARFLAASIQEQTEEAVRQEQEIRHLKSARRWSRSFIFLLSLGLTIAGGLLLRPYYLRFRALHLGQMVYIPAGVAVFGSDSSDYDDEDRPEWRTELAGFQINKHLISNHQYRLCVEAGFCKDVPDKREFYDLSKARNPVRVNAFQAAEYCSWLNQKLPTELQWERAARGSKGEEMMNLQFKQVSEEGVYDLIKKTEYEVTRTLSSSSLMTYGDNYPKDSLWEIDSASEEDFIIVRSLTYNDVSNIYVTRFLSVPNNPHGWNMRCVI